MELTQFQRWGTCVQIVLDSSSHNPQQAWPGVRDDRNWSPATSGESVFSHTCPVCVISPFHWHNPTQVELLLLCHSRMDRNKNNKQASAASALLIIPAQSLETHPPLFVWVPIALGVPVALENKVHVKTLIKLLLCLCKDFAFASDCKCR